jgi:hypothetical protein
VDGNMASSYDIGDISVRPASFASFGESHNSVGWLLVLTCGIMYYAALSQLTFEGGAARERLVKGMVCTEEALLLKPYRDNCPFLNDQLINSAESTERLWTTSSITTSRLLLLSLWLILYTGIAACFALFITFQSQQKSRLRVVANKSQD